MFQSQPICVLKAGPTIDGRDIPQKVIDDIAETYDPKRYTARINDDHLKWSWKGGSVLSVEKKHDEIWAVIKPNSHLLRNIENGQLLHTSCEYIDNFASSGKAYLTGLAFTDEPASLGTTQVYLSANEHGKDRVYACTGQTLNLEHPLKQSSESDDESSLFQKFKSWLKGEESQAELLSKQEETEEMNTETEVLLKQSIEQNQELNSKLGKLVEQLSAQNKPEESEAPETPEKTPLELQVEKLSSQVDLLNTTLSSITDEGVRKLAGQDGDEIPYL